ncbi:hypothetical protein PAERUG_P40_Scotland_4_VIM_2_09_12_04104 [Pseudomonas aeruginosa]|nr:hypothetical protein [Pseudomonas aeruginosa]CRN66877.1 hypothetical protein PAERUG_P40_Scotland_4_VIM_2_09_12_04104 [Pseudomonas aeruginosa]
MSRPEGLWPFTEMVLDKIERFGCQVLKIEAHSADDPEEPDRLWGELTPHLDLSDGEYLLIDYDFGAFNVEFGARGCCGNDETWGEHSNLQASEDNAVMVAKAYCSYFNPLSDAMDSGAEGKINADNSSLPPCPACGGKVGSLPPRSPYLAICRECGAQIAAVLESRGERTSSVRWMVCSVPAGASWLMSYRFALIKIPSVQAAQWLQPLLCNGFDDAMTSIAADQRFGYFMQPIAAITFDIQPANCRWSVWNDAGTVSSLKRLIGKPAAPAAATEVNLTIGAAAQVVPGQFCFDVSLSARYLKIPGADLRNDVSLSGLVLPVGGYQVLPWDIGDQTYALVVHLEAVVGIRERANGGAAGRG